MKGLQTTGTYDYQDIWGTGDLKAKLLQIGNNTFHNDGDLEKVIEEKTAEARVLQAIIQARPEETGVEIGSGSGVHTRYFAGLSKFLYTVDVTDNFLDLFEQITRGIPNIQRIRRSFFPMMEEIDAASVNYVFSTSVFCHLHIYDIYLYFEELARVLKPGGRFYVNFQNADNLEFDDFFHAFLENYRRGGVFRPIYPSQMQFHSEKYFKHLAARYGFSMAHQRVAGTYSEFVFVLERPLAAERANQALGTCYPGGTQGTHSSLIGESRQKGVGPCDSQRMMDQACRSGMSVPQEVQDRKAIENKSLEEASTEKAINLIEQADIGVKKGDLNGARKLISQALQFLPEHPRLIVNRGNINLQLGDIEAAHQDFARASVLAPRFFPALIGLATVQMSMNQFGKAEATLLRVLSLEPGNAKAKEMLAHLSTHQDPNVGDSEIRSFEAGYKQPEGAIQEHSRSYTLKQDAHKRHSLLLIGVQCTPLEQPHSMALLSGIVERAGWKGQIENLSMTHCRDATRVHKEQLAISPECCKRRAPKDLGETMNDYYISNHLLPLLQKNRFEVVAFNMTPRTNPLLLKTAECIRSLNPEIPVLFVEHDSASPCTGVKFFETRDILSEGPCSAGGNITFPEFLRAFETCWPNLLTEYCREVVPENDPETKRVLDIMSVDNIYDMEIVEGQSFVWLGESYLKIVLHAEKAGVVVLKTEVLLGPSIPDYPFRRVLLTTNRGYNRVLVWKKHKEKREVEIPVQKGSTTIKFQTLDKATWKGPLANGDRRNLILGMQNASVRFKNSSGEYEEAEEYLYPVKGKARMCFSPGHFHSPIVNPSGLLPRKAELLRGRSPLGGISLKVDEQVELLKRLRALYYEEIPFKKDRQQELRYYFDNPFYGQGDGTILFYMLRYLRPRRLIEIGCGFSSCLVMDTNDRFLDSKMECIFVDPNPFWLLSELGPEDLRRVNLIDRAVQDVKLELFELLGENDVLLIDSTHVAKTGSDVNRLFFDVIPVLKRGVVIAFHDIGANFEYPEDWIFGENRSWNEAYLLRAFLQYNSKFKILLYPAQLGRIYEAGESKRLDGVHVSGMSIWIQKAG